jgi:hypothetical protein
LFILSEQVAGWLKRKAVSFGVQLRQLLSEQPIVYDDRDLWMYGKERAGEVWSEIFIVLRWNQVMYGFYMLFDQLTNYSYVIYGSYIFQICLVYIILGPIVS